MGLPRLTETEIVSIKKSFNSTEMSLRNIGAIFVAVMSPWGLLSAAPTDISEAIAPLVDPSLETARSVVASLESLAKASPETNRTASAVASSLKEIFTRENGLRIAGTTLNRRFLEAHEMDGKASEHLKPNGLGTINKLAAEEKFKLAQVSRQQAVNGLNTAIISLGDALDDFRAKLPNYSISVADQKILSDAALAIENRSLNPARLASAARAKETQQPAALYEAPFSSIHAGGPDELFAGKPNIIDGLFHTLEETLPRVMEA